MSDYVDYVDHLLTSTVNRNQADSSNKSAWFLLTAIFYNCATHLSKIRN
ncbi:4760_t:CDS:1, partial [Gigaspora margarita]